MYLNDSARCAALGSNIHLLIGFHSFSEFNTLIMYQALFGEGNLAKKATKAKVPAFMKCPFLWEELDKEGGNQYID